MKKAFLFPFLIFCSLFALQAQNCYQATMSLAKQFYQEAKYKQATKQFKAALTCEDKPAMADSIKAVENWIKRSDSMEVIRLRVEVNKNKALFLSSEVSKWKNQNPTQAIRLLEYAYHLDSTNELVNSELISVWNASDTSRFYAREYMHESLVTILAISLNQNFVVASYGGTIRLCDSLGNIKWESQAYKEISNVLFSPNGEKLYIAAENKIAIVNLEGKLLGNFLHPSSVAFMALSPKEDLLVTGYDKDLYIWKISDFKLQSKMQLANPVSCISFSHSGSKFAVGTGQFLGNEGEVYIYTNTGKETHHFPHGGTVNSAAFNANDKQILSASVDKSVKVWDLEKNKLLTTFLHENDVDKAIFSPSENMVLSTAGGIAYLWDLKGNLIKNYPHKARINSLQFDNQEKRILIASSDNTAALWDIKGEKIANYQHEGFVNDAAFIGKSGLILTVSSDNTSRLWADYETNVILKHRECVRHMSYNKDNHLLCAAENDYLDSLKGNIYVWDLSSTPKLINFIPLHTPISSLQSSKKCIFVAYKDTCALFSIEGKFLFSLSFHSTIESLAIPSSETKFIVTCENGNIYILDEAGKIIRQFVAKDKYLYNAFWDKDDKHIIICTAKFIYIINEQGTITENIYESERIRKMIVSPDFTTMAFYEDNPTGSTTGSILHFLNRNNSQKYSLNLQKDGLHNMAISNDNQFVISTSVLHKKATLRNKNLVSLAEFYHKEWVFPCIFLENDHSIANADDGGNIIIWKLPISIVKTLKTANIAPLSPELIKRYNLD